MSELSQYRQEVLKLNNSMGFISHAHLALWSAVVVYLGIVLVELSFRS